MNADFVFSPTRQFGLLFQFGLTVLFSALAGWGLWQATRATIGPTFLLYLVPVILAVGFVPILAYRAYALYGAWYAIERDGIHLRWGLRVEDIPMDTILWVRPASELGGSLPLPLTRWPGAVLGVRQGPGSSEVEYLASSITGLVVIATPNRLYAVSPADPVAFLRAYHRVTELGSLTPIPARSVLPTFLLSRVWSVVPARLLLLAGLAFSLALLVWVSLAIPTQAQVFLGFDALGQPRDLVPAVRLLLLPVLNAVIFLVDLLLGLFFFRRGDAPTEGRAAGELTYGQVLAFLLWGNGALVPLMFLIGVFFILRG